MWGKKVGQEPNLQAAFPVEDRPKPITMSQYEALSKRIAALEEKNNANLVLQPAGPSPITVALGASIRRLENLFQADLLQRGLEVVKVQAVPEHEEIRPIVKQKPPSPK